MLAFVQVLFDPVSFQENRNGSLLSAKVHGPSP
jgi:hypothetical protein